MAGGALAAAAAITPQAFAQIADRSRPLKKVVAREGFSPALNSAIEKSAKRMARSDYGDIQFLLRYRKLASKKNPQYNDLLELFNGDRNLTDTFLKEIGASREDIGAGSGSGQEKRARPFWRFLGRVAGAIVNVLIGSLIP